MKKRIAFAVLLMLWPTLGFSRYHEPPRHWDGPPRDHRYYPPPPPHHGGRHHHDDDWIVPLAVFGTALGIAAIAQQPYAPPPPPPPQRMCRDSYNHYDAYGRFLYTEYIDRPCY